MTLREFLKLELLWDNVEVKEFVPDNYGLGELHKCCTLLRNYGRVDEAKLCEAGLKAEYLDYKVREIYGHAHKFKTLLVIEKDTTKYYKRLLNNVEKQKINAYDAVVADNVDYFKDVEEVELSDEDFERVCYCVKEYISNSGATAEEVSRTIIYGLKDGDVVVDDIDNYEDGAYISKMDRYIEYQIA